jgi:hypothetical protein
VPRGHRPRRRRSNSEYAVSVAPSSLFSVVQFPSSSSPMSLMLMTLFACQTLSLCAVLRCSSFDDSYVRCTLEW